MHYAGHLFSVSALLMSAAKKTCQSNKQEAKPSKMKRSHRQIMVAVSKINKFQRECGIKLFAYTKKGI